MPARLSDVFRDHPIEISHKHLDFHSLDELPDSYAWIPPPSSSPAAAAAAATDDGYEKFPIKELPPEFSIPVIDLADDPSNAKKLLGHACMSWGAFQITNHGIPIDLLDKIESWGKNLFNLPVQQKLKAARPPDGVSGYGLARISSFFQKLMWSEGFTVVGSPLEHARQLWPNDHLAFCGVIEEYEKEMKVLATKLMWLMLGALDVTKEDIKWAGSEGNLDEACAALQFNSYPACPDPDRAMGLAAHTDSTLFTILYQNSTKGLQVLKEGVGWVTVPPIPGALVVNVGDLLHILSNGLYPSVLHRAMVNRNKHRLSVAYLYGPPSSVQISPVERLVSPARPPLYRPITWSEYLGTKAKHFNKALSSVRVCPPLMG